MVVPGMGTKANSISIVFTQRAYEKAKDSRTNVNS